MSVSDVFKVYLYADPLLALNDYTFEDGEDITSGIMNVDIQNGTNIYEGPQQQIDTGQFTIVTRNPNLDPKINTNLKYNSAIKFRDLRTGEFFRGYVTNVQVEYQRKDDPIITITGTDIFGAMQRVVVDQDTHDAIMALSTGPTWNGLTFSEFIPYMIDFTSKYLDLDAIVPAGFPAPYGFWFNASQAYAEQSVENLGYSPAKYIPQVGESYLDVINKYAQTNMTSFSAKNDMGSPLSYNSIGVYSFPKYDPNYWSPQQNPMLEYTTYDFSSDPVNARPYQSILLNNGYNRVINQADISNEYRYVDTGELKSQSESFTRIASQSIEDYAISRASISTIYPEDATLSIADWADGYSKNIFQVTQYPGQEIQQITFDNARYEDVENNFSYSGYDLNRIVRIKHEINDEETIDRIYDIAGISHNISPNNWEMTFTLKPNAQEVVYQYQGQFPSLQLNSTNGDANFNFTATVGSVNAQDVSSITWALSATDSNEIAKIWPYAYSGNMFKNGVPRTGFTQTWNFDDDGILAPYSFDGDSTFSNPLDNRFGGYGPGNWTVYAYITLTNGFTIVLQQGLVVGTPAVEADFGWTQNLTNNFSQVSFTDTSVNHETGEPDSYLWNFGDGTTSLERNPVKVYDPAPGQTTYSVSLRVFAYGPGGTKVYNTKTKTVTLVQPTMTPNYTYTSFNTTFTFTNTSTNVGFEEPDAYLWNFGDGTTSTLKNPTKTYPAFAGQTASFNVSLTTRNIWEQTATVTKTITFTATFAVGNYPVDSIRFRSGNFTGAINQKVTPLMYNLKALTTGDNNNLLLNVPAPRTNTVNIIWREADGTLDETTDPLNLTRQVIVGFTPRSTYGLAASLGNTTTQNFTFNTTLPSPTLTLQNFSLDLEDITAGNTESWRTVYVDINSNLGWREVGYFRVGRGQVGDWDGSNLDPDVIITRATRPMTPTRVLPINNLNFDYTQDANSRTVRFTTAIAGPWAWNFGDGTTSTLQNPVKTYSSNLLQEYTVTLNGVTEIIKIRFPIPFAFRWLRIKQKTHTGNGEYATPALYNLQLETVSGRYISPGGLTNPQSIMSQKYSGAGGFTIPLGGSVISLIGSQSLTNSTGIRFRSQEPGYQTQWDLAVDYKELITTAIEEITMKLTAPLSAPGGIVSPFPEYEIFASAHNADATSMQQGDPLLIPGWVKVGEIKNFDYLSTRTPAGKKTFTMIPQYT